MHQRACREASAMARSSAFGAFSCMSDLVSSQSYWRDCARRKMQVRQHEITSLYSEAKRLRGKTYGPRPILTGSAVLLLFLWTRDCGQFNIQPPKLFESLGSLSWAVAKVS